MSDSRTAYAMERMRVAIENLEAAAAARNMNLA